MESMGGVDQELSFCPLSLHYLLLTITFFVVYSALGTRSIFSGNSTQKPTKENQEQQVKGNFKQPKRDERARESEESGCSMGKRS